MEHNQDVTPPGSGCQPTASAAEEASSQSGIPNAMRSVADKLERGSRGALMDAVVAAFLGWSSLKTVRGGVVGMAPGSRRSTQRVPRFTGSLDDALAVIPPLNGREPYPQVYRYTPTTWRAHVGYCNKAVGVTSEAPTGALALCAVGLRALAIAMETGTAIDSEAGVVAKP